MKGKNIVLLAVVMWLVSASSVWASTVNTNYWYNENSNVHTMQVWVSDPSISIKDVKINTGQSTAGWTWKFTDDTKQSVVFSGPEVDVATVASHLQFTVPKHTNFSVEWAEVSKQTTLTGTNYFKNNKWYYTKGDISHTPTPIPGTFLLFGGGLSLIAFFRREFRRG